jgi:hypothetical protein
MAPNANAASRSGVAPTKRVSGLRDLSLRRRPDCARQRAGEPENDENDKHQPEHAAESSPAISPVSIIAAPAAQQNDDKNDQQNRRDDGFPFFL